VGVRPPTAGEIWTFERVGSSTFEVRDRATGLADVAGLHYDAGVLLYGTRSGAAGAIVRGPAPGALSAVRGADPGGVEGEMSGFFGTTDDDDQPLVAVGLGRVVRIVRFTCG
jgi:hypothetical protein